LALAGATNSRTELFINGTSPGSETNDAEDMAQDSADDATEDENNRQTEPAYLPEPLPEPPKPKPTPKIYDSDSNRLQGTITLDVDPATNLIAVDTCPVIRTRTFIIGQEPRKYCGPEYHKKASASPPATAQRARPPNRN
jgi:hypothetical protein